jgi:protein gp37
MSDLFQDGVSDDYIVAVARIMMAANWHTYQILTKRSERMRDMLNAQLRFAAQSDHIWWGVSVEDRLYGVPRIGHLEAASASVRFLSIEPLLEDPGELNLTGIHWVIVGGESGPGARPMALAWVESVFAQCRRQNVPFFFKQWGGIQKSRTGRLLHERTYDELPLTHAGVELPGRIPRRMLFDQFEELTRSFMTEDYSASQRKTRPSAKKDNSSKRRARPRLAVRNARAARA